MAVQRRSSLEVDIHQAPKLPSESSRPRPIFLSKAGCHRLENYVRNPVVLGGAARVSAATQGGVRSLEAFCLRSYPLGSESQRIGSAQGILLAPVARLPRNGRSAM
jgi:hypothetical protein